MKTYYHHPLLVLALSSDCPEWRKLLGYLARMRPGTVIPEPKQIAERLGIDRDTCALMLDSVIEAGGVIPEPDLAEAA